MHQNLLIAIALATSLVIGVLIRKLFSGVKKPNKKGYGLVNLHTTLAFSIVTAVAITTGDYFITGLMLILAYLTARTQLLSNLNYFYQIVFSALLGIGITWGVFTLSENNISHDESRNDYTEIRPSNAVDDREEADTQAPELKLKTPKESPKESPKSPKESKDSNDELTSEEKAFLESMKE